MIRPLIACVLLAASGAASAGLDTTNSDVLRLHQRTVRSVSVVTAIEGHSAGATAAYASAMKQWIEEGLKQNGFVIDSASKSAPDLRFGGYCGKAVDGCSLRLYVARDLSYDLPNGSVYRLLARDVAEDKVSAETASYTHESMYPLFVEMVTKFVQVVGRVNPVSVPAPMPAPSSPADDLRELKTVEL